MSNDALDELDGISISVTFLSTTPFASRPVKSDHLLFQHVDYTVGIGNYGLRCNFELPLEIDVQSGKPSIGYAFKFGGRLLLVNNSNVLGVKSISRPVRNDNEVRSLMCLRFALNYRVYALQ